MLSPLTLRLCCVLLQKQSVNCGLFWSHCVYSRIDLLIIIMGIVCILCGAYIETICFHICECSAEAGDSSAQRNDRLLAMAGTLPSHQII